MFQKIIVAQYLKKDSVRLRKTEEKSGKECRINFSYRTLKDKKISKRNNKNVLAMIKMNFLLKQLLLPTKQLKIYKKILFEESSVFISIFLCISNFFIFPFENFKNLLILKSFLTLYPCIICSFYLEYLILSLRVLMPMKGWMKVKDLANIQGEFSVNLLLLDLGWFHNQ